MYYRNAQSALVVYDITKASSLVKAKHWVAELQRQASPGIVIALVGNKLDLVEDEEEGGEAVQQEGLKQHESRWVKIGGIASTTPRLVLCLGRVWLVTPKQELHAAPQAYVEITLADVKAQER